MTDGPGIHPPLEQLAVPIDSLRPYHQNARTHDLRVIRDSLRINGMYRPLVVNRGTRTGRPDEILAGNGTWAAAREEGWARVPATWVDVDDDAAARIVLVDNRANDLAGYDDLLLVELLGTLPDLAGTGFTTDDLDELLAAVTDVPEGLTDPDEVPDAPEDPVTKTGDVWVLGEHRLVCGDATDVGAYRTLLGEEGAQMVWTDPPYGVAYVGKTVDSLTIENDTLDLGQLTDFLRESLGAAYAACRPGAMWYVTSPPGPAFLSFGQVLTELGVWRQTLTWVKDVFVLGHSDYHYRHEPMFYGWHPGGPRLHATPDRTQDSVWEIPRPQRSGDHPTMKPVDLVARALENSSRRGDLILDPFGGSGSTLIAAQATGRRARLIELDPRYADVICRRFQEFTGTQPVLEASGRGVDFTRGEG